MTRRLDKEKLNYTCSQFVKKSINVVGDGFNIPTVGRAKGTAILQGFGPVIQRL